MWPHHPFEKKDSGRDLSWGRVSGLVGGRTSVFDSTTKMAWRTTGCCVSKAGTLSRLSLTALPHKTMSRYLFKCSCLSHFEFTNPPAFNFILSSHLPCNGLWPWNIKQTYSMPPQKECQDSRQMLHVVSCLTLQPHKIIDKMEGFWVSLFQWWDFQIKQLTFLFVVSFCNRSVAARDTIKNFLSIGFAIFSNLAGVVGFLVWFSQPLLCWVSFFFSILVLISKYTKWPYF